MCRRSVRRSVRSATRFTAWPMTLCPAVRWPHIWAALHAQVLAGSRAGRCHVAEADTELPQHVFPNHVWGEGRDGTHAALHSSSSGATPCAGNRRNLSKPRIRINSRVQQTAIDANLSLHLVSDGRDLSRTNVMTYVEGVTSDDHHAPPSIHFDVSIPASDHSLLLNNIRGGITPSSVRVELRHELYGKGSPVDYEGGANALAQCQKQAGRHRKHQH